MATDDTFSEPGERHINWGGVLKGAAIVVGVAVAAVVGMWAVGLLSSTVIMPALTNVGANGVVPASSSLLYGVHSAGVSIAAGFHAAVVSISGSLGWATGEFVKFFGLAGKEFAQTAAVNHTMGIIGGAVAGAAAVHATLPALQHTQLTTVTPPVDTTTVDTGALATQSINLAHMPGTLPLHDLAHMTHHAAEHANEHASAAWTEKFQPRPAYASYSDHVLAAKEERREKLQPTGSFAEQLNTDRANLDQILAK